MRSLLTGRGTTAPPGPTEQREDKDGVGKKNAEGAKLLGKRLAEIALEIGVKNVVFDRGGYKYHGRVKAIADAVREAGFKF